MGSSMSSLVSVVYPAYASYKALEYPQASGASYETKRWMTYWMLYAFVQVLDKACRLKQRMGASSHALLKTLAMLCLMTPRTRPGALVFYNRFVQPFLKRYEHIIDEKIDEAQVKTLELIQEIQEDPKEALNKHIVAVRQSPLIQQVTKELQKQQQQFIQLVQKSLEKSKPLLQQLQDIPASNASTPQPEPVAPAAVVTKDQKAQVKAKTKTPSVSRRTTVAKADTIQRKHVMMYKPQQEKEQEEQVEQVEEVEIIHTQRQEQEGHEEMVLLHRAVSFTAKQTAGTSNAMVPEISFTVDEIGLPLEEEEDNNHTI